MIDPAHIAAVADEQDLAESQIQAVVKLLREDATVPFIARYRKEVTGSLDEVQITVIRDRLSQLAELDTRKTAILKSLEKHGHLTAELQARVETAATMAVLEDIYLPYRPKRRTRATIAKEKGLAPLAHLIFEQTGIDPRETATEYVDSERGVDSIEDALSGARDIIAEMVNEDEQARSRLRELFAAKSRIQSTVATDKATVGIKYKDYFDWQEPAIDAPSHRILAMRRGETEDILNLTITPPEDQAIRILEKLFIKGDGPDRQQVTLAVKDSYKRLLSHAMETEIRLATKERADTEAIRIFAENLRELLLAPPLGAKRTMGIDPGFRTGCKAVCLDSQGQLLQHETIYPHTSANKAREAARVIQRLCEAHGIEAIAVGNGTAGRETETFMNNLPLAPSIQIIMVNESGASVYSASKVARNEFPDLDLTVRGAVSIGRRLMDPLAELVKIDPKSIGVGQYQHDVDQGALKQALDDVVISCVNGVGVDVNRASIQLLTYVSGLGPQLAANIVKYRNDQGPFKNRQALKKVSRLGPKAFEQSAGFLRIPDSDNPLDASAVHPESYSIVDTMAHNLDCTVRDLIQKTALRERIDPAEYVTETIGLPTLKDILQELAKPGRDPRQKFEAFAFAEGIETIDDLEVGMKLPGIVTNVTAFGAFVDIGVHQDGLVHISELANRFVKDPSKVVRVQQKVKVRVIDIDSARNRISLSMKSPLKPKKKSVKKTSPPRKANKQRSNRKPQPFNNPFAEAFSKK